MTKTQMMEKDFYFLGNLWETNVDILIDWLIERERQRETERDRCTFSHIFRKNLYVSIMI